MSPPPIVFQSDLDEGDLSPAAFRVLGNLSRRQGNNETAGWVTVDGYQATNSRD